MVIDESVSQILYLRDKNIYLNTKSVGKENIDIEATHIGLLITFL